MYKYQKAIDLMKLCKWSRFDFVGALNLFRKSINVKTIGWKVVREENTLIITTCPLDIYKSTYKKENYLYNKEN